MNITQAKAKQVIINTTKVITNKIQFLLSSSLFLSVACGRKLVDVTLLKKKGEKHPKVVFKYSRWSGTSPQNT